MSNLRSTPNTIIYSLYELIQKLTWFSKKKNTKTYLISLLSLNPNTLRRGRSTQKILSKIFLFSLQWQTLLFSHQNFPQRLSHCLFSVDLTQTRCGTLFALSTLSPVLFTWINLLNHTKLPFYKKLEAIAFSGAHDMAQFQIK